MACLTKAEKSNSINEPGWRGLELFVFSCGEILWKMIYVKRSHAFHM